MGGNFEVRPKNEQISQENAHQWALCHPSRSACIDPLWRAGTEPEAGEPETTSTYGFPELVPVVRPGQGLHDAPGGGSTHPARHGKNPLVGKKTGLMHAFGPNGVGSCPLVGLFEFSVPS